MVTGRVPYNAETPIAIVFKHIQDPLPSARKINPDLPDSVELILLKALAKKPEDRYQNMEDFLKAIRSGIPETPQKDIPIEKKTVAVQQAEKTRIAPVVHASDTPKRQTGIMKYVFIGFILLALLAGGIWGIPRLMGSNENTPKSEPIAPATEGPPTKAIVQNPTEPKPMVPPS